PHRRNELRVLRISGEETLQDGDGIVRALGTNVHEGQVVVGLDERGINGEGRLELGNGLVVLPQVDVSDAQVVVVRGNLAVAGGGDASSEQEGQCKGQQDGGGEASHRLIIGRVLCG